MEEVSRYPCLPRKRQLKKKEKKETKIGTTRYHDRIGCKVLLGGVGSARREEKKRPKKTVPGAQWRQYTRDVVANAEQARTGGTSWFELLVDC